MFQIRPATRDDVVKVLGQVPVTVRALVADEDGDTIGLAGVFRINGQSYFFGELTDRMRHKHTVTMVKTARKMIANAKPPVLAIADASIEKSAKFLSYLGFIPTEQERLMLWQPLPHTSHTS